VRQKHSYQKCNLYKLVDDEMDADFAHLT